MRRFGVFTACLAALALGAPAPSSHSALIAVAKGNGSVSAKTNQSNNWSGYNQGLLEKGSQFHAISGTWTVPTATARKQGENEYSATWDGIGGGCVDAACTVTDNTLIQAGTEQDISTNGQATYSAWYELIPAPSITIPLAVTAGNQVKVTIAEGVPEVWTITVANLSTGQSWNTTVPYASTYATAEWIEETPLTCCPPSIGPLPNLSTVHFDLATTNGADASLVSSEEMQLVALNGSPLATPSAPDGDTDGFNDCAYSTTCSSPSSS